MTSASAGARVYVMAAKTITRTKNVFVRDSSTELELNKAIFELDIDPKRPGVTRITLPADSVYHPGKHWHESHVEIFKVIQGRVAIYRDGTTTEVGPDDGPITIDKFVVHDFWRADAHKQRHQKDPEDVITEEWTEPDDVSKQIFFRNVFSTIEDADRYWGWWLYPQALLTSARCDNFVQLVEGRLSYLTTHAVYSVISTFARLLGLHVWYEEYTPPQLRSDRIHKQ